MAVNAHQLKAMIAIRGKGGGLLSSVSYGAMVMFKPTQDVRAYSFGSLVMHIPEPALKAYTYGITALYKHTPDTSAFTYGAAVMYAAQENASGGQEYPARLGIEETDMIYSDVFFPACIGYGSTALPRYRTDKVEVLSGDEQRNTRYRYARHEYGINLENANAAEISEILNIWHVCGGDFAGFMFQDPMDHTSNNTAASVSGSTVTNLDQHIATASGGLTDYELIKEYQVASRLRRRRIKFPDTSTLVVAVDGNATTQWFWDNETHMLVFERKVNTTTNVIKVGNAIQLSSGSWLALGNPQVGDLINVEGFVNPANDASGDPLRVLTVNATTLTLERYNGTAYAGTNETDVPVTLLGSLPPTGATITAGYEFYVPVRFDDGDNGVAELVAGARESAFANYGDLKLIELLE